MIEPLLMSFSSFEAAVEARQAMVDAGIAPTSADLRVQEDEAGPPEGNFLVGNGRTADGGQLTVGGRELGPETPYASNFKSTVWRGACVLIVANVDAAQRAAASSIAERFRAVDVARRRSLAASTGKPLNA